MTPEEKKASDIMDNACLGEPWIKNGVDAQLRKDITAGLRESIQDERKACAALVRSVTATELPDGLKAAGELLAKNIEARP
jgi:hypothetical protein